MLARIPLLPVLLITSFAGLIAAVLWIVGMPMAGTWSALCAAGVSGLLTLLMAFAFSHDRLLADVAQDVIDRKLRLQ